MAKSTFMYVTYIRSTPEKVWEALTTPEFAKQYWFGMHIASDWQAGSPWQMLFSDGRVADRGVVLEADAPRRLVLRWRNVWKPEYEAEGETLCTITLEPSDGAVKLQVLHESERENAGLIQAVGGGWPKILSNLKSLLETGRPALEDKPH
jgi:uncharacterized protein YndB with AHSA1/START domain